MNQRRSLNRRTSRIPTRQIIYPMPPTSNSYHPEHDVMGHPRNLNMPTEMERGDTIRVESNQPGSIMINQQRETHAQEIPLLSRVMNNIRELFQYESTTIPVYDSSATQTGIVEGSNNRADSPNGPREAFSSPERIFNEGPSLETASPIVNEADGQREERSTNSLINGSTQRKTNRAVEKRKDTEGSLKRNREPRIDSLRSKMWMNLKVYSIDDIKKGLDYIKEKRRRALKITKDTIKIVHKKKYTEDSYLDIIGTNILWER